MTTIAGKQSQMLQRMTFAASVMHLELRKEHKVGESKAGIGLQDG